MAINFVLPYEKYENKNKNIVTIVGCGAAGISLFAQLVEEIILNKLQDKFAINIIDKEKIPNGGVAYNTDYHCNLLNMPVLGMSLYKNDPKHFYKWLLINQKNIYDEFGQVKINEGAHLPRKLYRHYLFDTFNASKKLAKKLGISVNIIVSEALKIEEYNKGHALTLKNDMIVYSHDIIFCVGGSHSNYYQQLTGTDGFYLTPYGRNIEQHSSIDQIDKKSDVMIIGTRLSAIDSVLMLQSNGHQGKIICASRDGQLPRVQGEYGRVDSSILQNSMLEKITVGGKLNLHQLIALIRCEIEVQEKIILDFKKILNPYKVSQKALLKFEIQKSLGKCRPWQAAIFNDNKIFNTAWMLLDQESQHLAFNKYLNVFLTFRAAMPLVNALKIYHLFMTKQMSVENKLSEISYDGHHRQYKAKVNNKDLNVDCVINATGITSAVHHSDNELVKNLVGSGIISKHRLGGFNVDPNTFTPLNGQNNSESRLFVIGAMMQGVHIATSLLEYIVESTATVSKSIIKRSLNNDYE